jgi:hypothetical protein
MRTLNNPPWRGDKGTRNTVISVLTDYLAKLGKVSIAY